MRPPYPTFHHSQRRIGGEVPRLTKVSAGERPGWQVGEGGGLPRPGALTSRSERPINPATGRRVLGWRPSGGVVGRSVGGRGGRGGGRCARAVRLPAADSQ